METKKSKDVLEDVDDITVWLEQRNTEIKNGRTDVKEKEMPVLARVICGGEDEIQNLDAEDREKYEKHFKRNKKIAAALTLAGAGVGAAGAGAGIATVASGIGTAAAFTGLGTAVSSASLGIAGMAGLGAVACVPILWPIGISMLAISAGAIFRNAKTKKGRQDRAEKLEKVFTDSQKGAQDCGEKIKKNNKKIKDILSQKLKSSLETLSEVSKKIAINIDDAINADQNLRIMQYQEIVLKQYNSHNEICKMLAELNEAYNKLVAENEELAKKIAAYEANMKMCGCTNNFVA